MIVGRALMVALGAFYWLYALRPRLPVIRAVPYFWRGNLPPAPERRAFAALRELSSWWVRLSSDRPFSARGALGLRRALFTPSAWGRN